MVFVLFYFSSMRPTVFTVFQLIFLLFVNIKKHMARYLPICFKPLSIFISSTALYLHFRRPEHVLRSLPSGNSARYAIICFR